MLISCVYSQILGHSYLPQETMHQTLGNLFPISSPRQKRIGKIKFEDPKLFVTPRYHHDINLKLKTKKSKPKTKKRPEEKKRKKKRGGRRDLPARKTREPISQRPLSLSVIQSEPLPAPKIRAFVSV